MNIISPVSTIMTTKLMAVNPEDSLTQVQEIFDNHNIHHIPVVRHKTILGIISKSDFLHVLHGFTKNQNDQILEDTRISNWKAKDIMTEKLVKIDSSEPIRTAIDLFKINWFHAIPVVDDGELVGMITTHDIIKKLAEEPVKLEDYQSANT